MLRTSLYRKLRHIFFVHFRYVVAGKEVKEGWIILVLKLSPCSKCNVFLFVIPRRLSSNSRRFGTHCPFHLHRQVNEVVIHLTMKMEPTMSSETSAIRTMTMEPTVSSKTSAIRTQTPGNYPKRNTLQGWIKLCN